MVAIAHSSISKRRSLSPAAYDEARQREDGSFRSSGVTRRAARAGRPQGEFFSQYSPYGKLIRSEGPMAERNPFRFSTKYLDTESGLYYYGLRYYDPHLGRFINRDPIEDEGRQPGDGQRCDRWPARDLGTGCPQGGEQSNVGGLNLYAAFNNDPVNTIDYLGMEPLSATIGNFLGRTLFNKVLGGIFGGGKQSLSSISYGDPRDIQYQRQNHMNVMADVARNHSFGYQDYLKATLGDLRKVLSAAETLGEYNEALGAVAKKLGTAVDKVQDFFNTTLGPIIGTDNVRIPLYSAPSWKCGEGINIKFTIGKGAEEADKLQACSQVKQALAVRKEDGKTLPESVKMLKHVVSLKYNEIEVVPSGSLFRAKAITSPKNPIKARNGEPTYATIKYSPKMSLPDSSYTPTATLVHEAAHAFEINIGRSNRSRESKERFAEKWENEFKYYGKNFGTQNDTYQIYKGPTVSVPLYPWNNP